MLLIDFLLLNKVEYSDGDEEDLWWSEVADILIEENEPETKPKKGRRPSKRRQGKMTGTHQGTEEEKREGQESKEEKIMEKERDAQEEEEKKGKGPKLAAKGMLVRKKFGIKYYEGRVIDYFDDEGYYQVIIIPVNVVVNLGFVSSDFSFPPTSGGVL